jgi:hypothetical protein
MLIERGFDSIEFAFAPLPKGDARFLVILIALTKHLSLRPRVSRLISGKTDQTMFT